MANKGFIDAIDMAQFAGATSPFNRQHEWKFARLLEIHSLPETNEQKRKKEILAAIELQAFEAKLSGMPRQLADLYIEPFKKRRELLLTEAVESATLIQTEMYSTVLEGAEPNKVMRDIVRIIPMKSNQMTFTLGATGSVLQKVGEGAELPNNQQDYTPVTMTSYKYGEKNLVTQELIDDALYDVVAMEVAKAGARAENTLNHVVLTGLLDDATNEHDTGGSNQGFQAIAGGQKLMKVDGFKADVAILCAEAEFKLLTDSQFTYQSYYGGTGVTPAVSMGSIPGVLGVRKFHQYDPFDTTYNSGTYTWSYDTDADIGMVLLDSARLSHVIGMKQDIKVTKYDDPVKDLKGATLTMRFAEESPFDNGICRIEY